MTALGNGGAETVETVWSFVSPFVTGLKPGANERFATTTGLKPGANEGGVAGRGVVGGGFTGRW